MWYSKFTILDKKDGFDENITDDYLTKPCSEKEFEFLSKYIKDGRTFKDFPIPLDLKLPEEYNELLKYSNGGTILNGEREFGYFDIETIREFYINYGFIMYAPNILPIAFNGGGTFYIYDFNKNIANPPIYAVHSSCVGDDDLTIFLGKTLDEVISKTINIDDEIDEKRLEIKLSDDKQRKNQHAETRLALNNELNKVKERKNNGEIDLKTFIKSKREIEQKLSELE